MPGQEITHEIGLFRAGDAEPAAEGRFVHVFVERDSPKPIPIPGRLRAGLAKLSV